MSKLKLQIQNGLWERHVREVVGAEYKARLWNHEHVL